MSSLDDYGFKPFDYDKNILPAQAISQMQDEVATWTAEKLEVEGELKVSQRELQELKVQTDYVLGLYARQEAKKNWLVPSIWWLWKAGQKQSKLTV